MKCHTDSCRTSVLAVVCCTTLALQFFFFLIQDGLRYGFTPKLQEASFFFFGLQLRLLLTGSVNSDPCVFYVILHVKRNLNTLVVHVFVCSVWNK
jgi:hypothetical protein